MSPRGTRQGRVAGTVLSGLVKYTRRGNSHYGGFAMAKKKPKPNRKPKQPRSPSRTDIPDRRALEGQMWGSFGGARGDSPLDQAQQIMYEAFEEPDERRKLDLAKEALAICPDCADAYVLLAEHAPTRKQALHLYEQGVAAGERALGPDLFREEAGHFWGLLGTRPYMRARLGLAHALWTTGRREEAVPHLLEMLRLNPNDNQGIRYTLAGFLFFLERDEDLAHLLEQYPDEGSAAWAYHKALLAFRQNGDDPAARRLLKEAKKQNKHVPAYLLGEKFPPSESPDYYIPGDESEALEYISSSLAAWKSTPGAIAWLRANIKPKKRTNPASRPKGPEHLLKKYLVDELPQEHDVWQVDFRQMPAWIPNGGQPIRPWVVLVASPTNELVLAHAISEVPPSDALLWDVLAQAILRPLSGHPHRPTEIHVRPDARWESLQPHLEEIGMGLHFHQELKPLAEILKQMCVHVCGEPRPGLLDIPGIRREQVGRFYEAAASFFREAPWKRVGYESAIRVECDKFQNGPWYAVLMGQSGLTMGVALYEDLKTLTRMWTNDGDDEQNARQTVAT